MSNVSRDPFGAPVPSDWDEIIEITPEPALETWQKVWRDGIAPQLSTAALEALERGLSADDQALVQGKTTEPPPLQCCQNWPVTACCAIGYAGWQGEACQTVADVEEYFARVCYQAEQALGEPAAVRWFLNWFDEQPRNLMRVQLLVEVQRSLAQRQPARRATA